ncbi:hypothetical protein J3F84DRAFT_380997 [Trichoderma pleuroticola]
MGANIMPVLRNSKTYSRSLPYPSGDKECADRACVAVMPCSCCENAGVGEKCKFSTRFIRY